MAGEAPIRLVRRGARRELPPPPGEVALPPPPRLAGGAWSLARWLQVLAPIAGVAGALGLVERAGPGSGTAAVLTAGAGVGLALALALGRWRVGRRRREAGRARYLG